MSAHDNSVNMNRPTYHHGDLRSALVEAGLALLAERNADDISLREVARAVGVSATAVYRHFPSKGALLSALARAGLDRLAAAQHAASDRAGGGAAGFGATGGAYVRFALANPALFRLIFTSPKPAEGPSAEPSEAMAFLRANAAAMAGAQAGGDDKVLALRAWSIAHGLAMLMLDGQAPAQDWLIDRVIEVEALGAGIGRTPA